MRRSDLRLHVRAERPGVLDDELAEREARRFVSLQRRRDVDAVAERLDQFQRIAGRGFTHELKALGADYVCVSSGSVDAGTRSPSRPASAEELGVPAWYAGPYERAEGLRHATRPS